MFLLTTSHGEFLRLALGDDDRARALKRDPESANLTKRERAMLEFSRKLTNAPEDM